MKGRRKLKTAKWCLKARLVAHARAILESEFSKQRQGKFLSIAESSAGGNEPVGLLAGRHKTCRSLANG